MKLKNSLFSFFKKHVFLILLSIIPMLMFLFMGLLMLISLINEDDDECSQDSAEETEIINNQTNGEWTQEGTQANANAKAEFMRIGKKWGIGGNGAAGAVGNTSVEDSNFDPMQAEIGFGGGKIDDPRSFTGAVGTHGYGLFQVSPGANYGNWSKAKIPVKNDTESVENEVDYMFEAFNQTQISHGIYNDKKHFKQLQQVKNPTEGADTWYRLVENGAGTNKFPQREAGAEKAYTIFGGENINPSNAEIDALNTANNGIDEDMSNGCDLLGDSEGSNDIVATAKKLIGYFTYSQPNRTDIGNMEKIAKGDISGVKRDGHTDCSGFVWLVLKLCSYNVSSTMWNTSTMENDALENHKWLKKIDKKEAKPGDVVIVNSGSGEGNNGHTAIITTPWKGDKTGIIQMGGRTERTHVNEDTFKESFLSLISQSNSLTLCRPVSSH